MYVYTHHILYKILYIFRYISHNIILLKQSNIDKILTRLAHEIVETNSNLDKLVIIGIRTRGEIIANRVVEKISNERKFVELRERRENVNKRLKKLERGGPLEERIIIIENVLRKIDFVSFDYYAEMEK